MRYKGWRNKKGNCLEQQDSHLIKEDLSDISRQIEEILAEVNQPLEI
jgi:hypothetical protein